MKLARTDGDLRGLRGCGRKPKGAGVGHPASRKAESRPSRVRAGVDWVLQLTHLGRVRPRLIPCTVVKRLPQGQRCSGTGGGREAKEGGREAKEGGSSEMCSPGGSWKGNFSALPGGGGSCRRKTVWNQPFVGGFSQPSLFIRSWMPPWQLSVLSAWDR